MNFKAGDKVLLSDFSYDLAQEAVKESPGWRCDTPQSYGPEKQYLVGREVVIDSIHKQLAVVGGHKGITWPLAAMAAVGLSSRPLWTWQAGDVLRLNAGHIYAGEFGLVDSIDSRGMNYSIISDPPRTKAYCVFGFADFVCRPGQRVKLLPYDPWKKDCGCNFGRVAEVAGTDIYEGLPVAILKQRPGFNDPGRWPLCAVGGYEFIESVTPWRDDSQAIIEVSPEPEPPIHPLVRLFVRPFVRRDPLDMLPAERELFYEMIKRREVKPVNCETPADSSTWNKKINDQIEEKRGTLLMIEAEIADLKKQLK